MNDNQPSRTGFDPVTKSGFFDRHRLFYKTGKIGTAPGRMNSRYEAIISRNLQHIKGKRILDIASHDGRWSFAALKAGADSVVGVECDGELVERAYKNFKHYGVHDGFVFLHNDIFGCNLQNEKFDTIFCNGFLYHTTKHAETFDLMARTDAQFIVLDTAVLNGRTNPNAVVYRKEAVYADYPPSIARDGKTLVAIPSHGEILFLAKHFGYSVEIYGWKDRLKHVPRKILRKATLGSQANGSRETFYLTRIS